MFGFMDSNQILTFTFAFKLLSTLIYNSWADAKFTLYVHPPASFAEL